VQGIAAMTPLLVTATFSAAQHVIVDSGNITTVSTVSAARIVGNAGAVLDATITAATAPANGLAVLSVNNTTAPSLTTGQSVAQQADYAGSVFVKPIRRSQTVAQATACTTQAATIVLAAQAAGVFADISHLSLTVLAVAIDLNFTVTLSDGTNNYLFNVNSGGVTSPSPGTGVFIDFNPPLPATTAATAWTLTMSTAETVNVNIVAVLQKAS
jgi:hypothetical protein